MAPSSTTTDHDLLDLLREGGTVSNEAFKVLYGRYAKRIYAYALKVLRTKHRASDITHDVFMRFLIAVNEGAQVENLAAYLMRITRNLCLNVRRDELMLYVEPEQVDPVDDDAETPEDRDLRQVVINAIDALPDHYREVLILQMYGGLSYAEICDVTGESLPTVRHRLSRAKERLRKKLLPLIVV